MSLSQFTIYTSSDASGPGPLTGTAGAIFPVLDACLVNGYSGKAAAGWTKPFANGSNKGCYKQGAGCGFAITVEDSGSFTGTQCETYVSAFKALSSVNSGSGQFPTSAQVGPYGYVVLRKSATADTTPRGWILFADASTFYLLVATGDVSNKYYDFSFGDFYALAGMGDPNRCFICGRATPNSAATGSPTSGTQLGSLDFTYSPRDEGALGSAAIVGWYLADNISGSVGSQGNAYRFGDTGKSITPYALYGSVPAPNSYDSSYYLSPVFVVDPSGGVRGYLRGFYHLCHAISGFTDGQTFGGANDFSGKTFQVALTAENGGMFCFETSATVNTN